MTDDASGVGLGAVTAILAVLAGASMWAGLGVAVFCFLVAGSVSTVRLVVSADHLTVGLGPFALRPRVLTASDVAASDVAASDVAASDVAASDVAASDVAVSAVNLSPRQVLGIGVPLARRTTRLTVRPGPTLVVELSDGETIRIATPDPDLAVTLGSAPRGSAMASVPRHGRAGSSWPLPSRRSWPSSGLCIDRVTAADGSVRFVVPGSGSPPAESAPRDR